MKKESTELINYTVSMRPHLLSAGLQHASAKAKSPSTTGSAPREGDQQHYAGFYSPVGASAA